MKTILLISAGVLLGYILKGLLFAVLYDSKWFMSCDGIWAYRSGPGVWIKCVRIIRTAVGSLWGSGK